MGLRVLRYIRCLTCVVVAAIQVQERTLIETFIIMTITMTGIIFPLTQSWIAKEGWLESLGFLDATHASVTFMVGGFCGLVGNVMIGPRLSSFQRKSINKSTTHSRKIKKMLDAHTKKLSKHNEKHSQKEKSASATKKTSGNDHDFSHIPSPYENPKDSRESSKRCMSFAD